MAFPGALELVYTILILLSFLANTNCQCQNGNANTETGKALIGVTFNSFTTINYSECLTECVRSTGCKSLNYLMTNRTCELNSETKVTRPHLLVRRENCTYTTKTAYHEELMGTRVSPTQSSTAQPPTTQTTTTQSSSSQPTTTQSPTTPLTTTGIPTTQPTKSPTTKTTTQSSTTQTTTTQSPTTQSATGIPTTHSTTKSPTIQTTTQSLTTQTTTTQSPTTQSATGIPTTHSTTKSPTIQTTTQSLTTQTTTTQSPTTQSATGIPTTHSTTKSPTIQTTQSSTTQSTTTGISTTQPTTQSPTTQTSTLLSTTGIPTTYTMTTDLSTTEPTTLSPTTQSTTTQAAQASYPRSCLEILRSGISTGDGEYSIDPNNAGVPIQAYCDMTTDGGGWTIIKRTIFQTSTPPKNKRFQTYEVISEFNTNKFNIYPTTKSLLDIKNTMGFHQLHFYCHKQAVGRVISIRTRNDTAGHKVVRYFTDDEFASTNFVAACGSFDRLPEDDSVLGQNCAKWNKDTGTWGKDSGSSRTLASTFFIKDANSFGCSVNPPKVEYCACDDDRSAPLSYNPHDRWQISVR